MTSHELSRTCDGLVRKKYGHIEHDQPRREWRALRLLHEYAPGLAPGPVDADLDATPPWITMEVLAGDPLGGQALSSSEERAVVEALDRLHTCVPRVALAAVPMVANHPRRAFGDIASRLVAQPRPEDDAVVARAYDEALRWLSGSEPNRLFDAGPDRPVFARVDHNLRNFLWDGDRARLVDFEYSGRSDRCAEIAELVEHLSARCTPDRTWQRLVEDVDLSRAEHQRLLTIRRLLAVMWLLKLLPGQVGASRNPPGTPRLQAQRALSLLSS